MEDKRKVIDESRIIQIARQVGFKSAAFMDVSDLTIVPEYRKYCEMNLCHCYDSNPSCPPASGTVEEMTARVMQYQRVLVLQTECGSDFADDPAGAKQAKQEHNMLADELMAQLTEQGLASDAATLRMSAGPWKKHSCMSAYSVDAQKMADVVGMVCWAKDGKSRFFSQILFKK